MLRPRSAKPNLRRNIVVDNMGSLFRRARQWRRPSLYFRGNRNRTSAILAHRAHRKKMVVGGNALQNCFARRSCKIINLPARVARIAPQNLEPRSLGVIFSGPRHFRVRRDCAGQFRIFRRGRSQCQLPQRLGIVSRHVAHIQSHFPCAAFGAGDCNLPAAR